VFEEWGTSSDAQAAIATESAAKAWSLPAIKRALRSHKFLPFPATTILHLILFAQQLLGYTNSCADAGPVCL
jgi:hypothetical protein